MNVQFTHILKTSFALWLDHALLNGAQAYQNVTGQLYPQQNSGVRGNVWAAPFKSWVADSCVNGATIISGAYNKNGQFLTRDSGIVIDYQNGRIISQQKYAGNLTGIYARKDYNIYTSTEDEIDWWLTEVYGANKNISYTLTGMVDGPFAAPCIILTNSRSTNRPWALGGMRESDSTIRAYVISNSQKPFYKEAVVSFLNDTAQYSFPLVSFGDVPYTASGDLKSGYYCYNDLCNQYSPPNVYIENVHSYAVNQRQNNATSFTVDLVEFDLNMVRIPGLGQ